MKFIYKIIKTSQRYLLFIISEISLIHHFMKKCTSKEIFYPNVNTFFTIYERTAMRFLIIYYFIDK